MMVWIVVSVYIWWHREQTVPTGSRRLSTATDSECYYFRWNTRFIDISDTRFKNQVIRSRKHFILLDLMLDSSEHKLLGYDWHVRIARNHPTCNRDGMEELIET